MSIVKNKFIKNASWMVGGKIAQMLISLFIGMITARYLGPENYGVINYAGSFIAFSNSICTLGLTAIIVKELISYPDKQGEILGTGIVMRVVSSLISMVFIVILVTYINPNDKIILIVTILQAIGVMFNSFDLINYWYQSRLESKYPAIISIISSIIISGYKVCILILNKDIKWFAFASSLDVICIASILIYIYKKNNGPRFKVSIHRAKLLIGKSYHYILSGLMVAVYAQMDKFMIGRILSIESVGYYSTALNICGLWTFVLYAIIDSARPIIVECRNKDYKIYEKRIRQLYAAVIWISIIVAIIFCVLARPMIIILYGEKYIDAIPVLRIITWYTSFSFLGVARSIWIVCEDKNGYEKKFAFWGALVNLLFNFILIPIYGINGAAFATLITQIITNIVIPIVYKETRINSKYILQAFMFNGIIDIRARW